jgi:hypothetical protein
MTIIPAIKGVITAVLMIMVVLAAFYTNTTAGPFIQYGVYGLYGAGIVWTLLAYQRSDQYSGKFADAFNQGFRCFIVVTLFMVLFTYVFNKMHPEFVTDSAALYKEQLVKDKSQLGPAIDTLVSQYKKGYITTLVYGSIFGYLIIGAVITAAMSALITRRR